MFTTNKGNVLTKLLGMLLLVGGLASGVVLVKQPQLFAQNAQTRQVGCSEDCTKYSGVHGYYRCDLTAGKRKPTCSTDANVRIVDPVGSYICSSDGNVAKVVMTKDIDPNCPDFKWYQVVQTCNPEVVVNSTYNKECATGVKYGRSYLGYIVHNGNTQIYQGGVACIPVSKVIVK